MTADELLDAFARILAPRVAELLVPRTPASTATAPMPVLGDVPELLASSAFELTPELLRERLKGAKGPSVYVNPGRKGRRRQGLTTAAEPRPAFRCGEKGTRNRNAKLDDARVLELRKAHRAGESLKSLCERTGLNPGTLVPMLRGKTWSHVAMP